MVNFDCTGSLTGNPGTDNLAIVIVGGGAELFMVDLSGGQAFTVDANKIEAAPTH
jgi:hypothetical protein